MYNMESNNISNDIEQLKLPEFKSIFNDIDLSSSDVQFLNDLSDKGAHRNDIGALSMVAINYKTALINRNSAKMQTDAAERAEHTANEMTRIQKDALVQAEKTAQKSEKHMNVIKWLTVAIAVSAIVQALNALMAIFC